MAPGVLGRNIKADNAFMNNHQSTAVLTSAALTAQQIGLLVHPHTYTRQSVTKRSHVLVSVVSTAWPPPTGPAHRCHSHVHLQLCGEKSSELRTGGTFQPRQPSQFHLSGEKNPETFLFSHNLSALLIIRPPVGFVRTFVLFATIFGRLFFALSRCQRARTCQTI